jgi:hypothetical protein
MAAAWRNLGLDAAMELLAATGKPDTTTSPQTGRLDDLRLSQQLAIEATRLRLTPGGDGHLHMVHAGDPHVASLRWSA